MIETQRIEALLLGTAAADERLLMEAQGILDPSLAEKVRLQRQVMEAATIYGRQKLIDEITEVDHRLVSSPEKQSFRQRILSIFQTR